MSDIVLTPAERRLLEALQALGVRFLVVGLGAALIEGAPVTTQDLDLWFGRIDGERLQEAAGRAGGFYTPGFGLQPPAVGGDGLDRIDLVLTRRGSSPSIASTRGLVSTCWTESGSLCCRSTASSPASWRRTVRRTPRRCPCFERRWPRRPPGRRSKSRLGFERDVPSRLKPAPCRSTRDETGRAPVGRPRLRRAVEISAEISQLDGAGLCVM